MKLAFAKAEGYKKDKKKNLSPIPEQNLVPQSNGGANGTADPDSDIPQVVKLAFEKTKEYKKNKRARVGDGNAAAGKPSHSGII
ncbi:hypothetical protein COCNU_16G002480 [Cocos nucifera]|uniref:Uncharacterized protein n=1 Tax=Cocos nucifera TaxID=13894 RepID=A0A8K0IY54_COCNU|nr:hypothetical protein COCNU_16G002480 [Cocos nucifera]